MRKLRISIVEYLNTAPLVWGFTDGPLAGKYDLSFTVPSQCAEALRRGDVDLAIIPSIEYQRIDDLVVMPGISVAAKDEVRSLLVVAKKPIELAKRIALDSSSRATQALVKILADGLWNIHPEFVEAAPDASQMLKNADAALIIGDPALRIAMKMEALAAKVASGEDCCKGDPEDMPVPGFETTFVYDVAYQWRELTGKPCVLAVWAGRPEAICEAAAIKLDMPPRELERYLIQNIHFGLEEEYLDGLRLYYEKAAALGIIPRNKPLHFAGAAIRGAATAKATQ
jgi:chorismate dehydratase